MTRFLIAFLLGVSLSAYGKDGVGSLWEISGASEDVRIIRAKRPVPPSKNLILETDDEVSVVTDNTSVQIYLNDGTPVRVDKKNPYTLTAVKGNSVLGNMFRWFASPRKPAPASRTVMAATRGSKHGHTDKLRVPLVKEGATLIAGDRPVALAWFGGTGPVQVQLIRRDTRVVAFTGSYTTNRLVETVGLSPGVYEVLVRDANSRKWRGKVVVVEEQKLPSSPASFNEFPPEIGETLNIAWLAGHDQGKWILEAYARLTTKSHRTDNENRLLAALEEGHVPKLE